MNPATFGHIRMGIGNQFPAFEGRTGGYDGRPRPHHVGREQVRSPGGGDDDVGRAGDARHVVRLDSGVYHRDRGIAPGALQSASMFASGRPIVTPRPMIAT